MGQILYYLYSAPGHPSADQWITEGSEWRPSHHPPTPDIITLSDAAGLPISATAMTSMFLTLYDPSLPNDPIVAGVDHLSIKNTRSCTISSAGLFVLTLLPADTIIVDVTRAYEPRVALIDYTWAAGAKSNALEIHCVIRNLRRRPFVAP